MVQVPVPFIFFSISVYSLIYFILRVFDYSGFEFIPENFFSFFLFSFEFSYYRKIFHCLIVIFSSLWLIHLEIILFFFPALIYNGFRTCSGSCSGGGCRVGRADESAVLQCLPLLWILIINF